MNKENVEADASSSDEAGLYNIRPPISEKFNTAKVKMLIKSVVLEQLEGKQYGSFDPRLVSEELCKLISEKLKELPSKQYKYAVQIVLAEQKGQGMEFVSSCLWDADTDNIATEFINTENIICITSVFGVYFY